jgi:hypothetical protein
MVCISCNPKEEVSRNFVSESIIGKHVIQADIFTSFTDWWNSLSNTYKYVIIGGSIAVVALIIGIAVLPKKKVESLAYGLISPTTKELGEQLKLQLIKQLVQ